MTGAVTLSDVVTMTVMAGKPDAAVVAPGLGAFLAFFALALVCVVLGFSMTRRVRRSERRQALRDEQEDQAPGAGQSEGGTDGPGPAGDVEQTGAASPAGDESDSDTSGDERASGPAAREA